MVSPFPADPFGRCTCSPHPPAPGDPHRLIACASAIAMEHGGFAIHLTAALWGGNFARTVPLSVGEAYALGVELIALSQSVFEDEWEHRGARPTRGRKRSRAPRTDDGPADARGTSRAAGSLRPPAADESRPTRRVESGA